jgi:hypothetical protein
VCGYAGCKATTLLRGGEKARHLFFTREAAFLNIALQATFSLACAARPCLIRLIFLKTVSLASSRKRTCQRQVVASNTTRLCFYSYFENKNKKRHDEQN